MLDLNNSVIRNSRPVLLSSTVTKVEEGQFLVRLLENGEEVVKPSAGATGEVPAGFAASAFMDPSEAPYHEIVTVPASSPYTVTLTKTPLTPTTRMHAGIVGGANLAYDATPETGQFAVSGRTVTFHSAQAGASVKVQYVFAPTLTEAQLMYGQGIGDAGQSVTGKVSAIEDADIIFTDKFDPASDWWAAAVGGVYTGANGILTKATDGTLLSNVQVAKAPSADNPFLGLYIRI